MTVSIQVLRDSYVKPKHATPTNEEVELAGVDVLFNRFNLRFSYFFAETLNATKLKESLAEVCGYAVDGMDMGFGVELGCGGACVWEAGRAIAVPL